VVVVSGNLWGKMSDDEGWSVVVLLLLTSGGAVKSVGTVLLCR
jgi:hypothetical protein